MLWKRAAWPTRLRRSWHYYCTADICWITVRRAVLARDLLKHRCTERLWLNGPSAGQSHAIQLRFNVNSSPAPIKALSTLSTLSPLSTLPRLWLRNHAASTAESHIAEQFSEETDLSRHRLL